MNDIRELIDSQDFIDAEHAIDIRDYTRILFKRRRLVISLFSAILILGIFNTGIGCYFYFSSIGDLPVQTVAICGYLEPLSAVVFSVLFLGESMTIVQVVGAMLILGGAAFGELFRSQNTNFHSLIDSQLVSKKPIV